MPLFQDSNKAPQSEGWSHGDVPSSDANSGAHRPPAPRPLRYSSVGRWEPERPVLLIKHKDIFYFGGIIVYVFVM